MNLIIKAVLSVLLLSMSSCYYDNLEELHVGDLKDCVIPETVSYLNDIKPIMNSACGTTNGACHVSPEAANLFIGLNTYADVFSSIDNKLMDAINHNSNASAMPKGGGKLDDCSISIIQKWIDQGAPNN